MGWTARAPAPDGTQSAPRACQEKEHHHASDVYGSRSDHHLPALRKNSEPTSVSLERSNSRMLAGAMAWATGTQCPNFPS
jgi:hypothetical protein